MNKGYVYLLYSYKDHRTYVGSTDNLDRRTTQHFDGKVISTRNRRPLKLIYTEEYDTLIEARVRESYLKTRQGRRELKEIFKKLNI